MLLASTAANAIKLYFICAFSKISRPNHVRPKLIQPKDVFGESFRLKVRTEFDACTRLVSADRLPLWFALMLCFLRSRFSTTGEIETLPARCGAGGTCARLGSAESEGSQAVPKTGKKG